jgi:CRISPR/Cas system-associated exonuclease Cas4 (RecB family)
MSGKWNILKKLRLVEDVSKDNKDVVTSEKTLEELLADDPLIGSAASDNKAEAAKKVFGGAAPAVEAVAASPGKLDLASIYAAAGITETEENIERAIELRKNMPAEAALDTQRQIVLAALKSFGISVKQLVTDAARKHEALELYLEISREGVDTLVKTNTEQIAQLQLQIQNLKNEINKKKQSVERLTSDVKTKVDEIEAAVDFLTEGEMITEQGGQKSSAPKEDK